MNFKIIACINNKYSLGINNMLLYHIKDDLRNFKKLTTNNVIIMGRKTFESLPNGALPNRINIIITSDKTYKKDNCYIVHSIEECVELCNTKFNDLNCFVIGGGKIYKEFIDKDLVNEMYLTVVDDDLEGDTYFPNVFENNADWKLINDINKFHEENDNVDYTYKIYKKY